MRFGVRKGACVTTLLFALLTVICLAGCGAGGDGGDGQIKILTDSRYVRIERLGISVGSCRSDNPDSADAVRSGDGRYVIVRAFSEGNAVISVGDFIGREASIAVTTGSDGKIISCEVSEYDGDDAGVDVLVAGTGR